MKQFKKELIVIIILILPIGFAYRKKNQYIRSIQTLIISS